MEASPPAARPYFARVVARGLRGRCPNCGLGRLFRGYLKPVDSCTACGERLDDIRTDDIASYFSILVTGHIIVPLLLLVEQTESPAVWVHWMIWPPATLILSLSLLPRAKGAVTGWMWWLGLKGSESQ